jgi:hypothetical protein
MLFGHVYEDSVSTVQLLQRTARSLAFTVSLLRPYIRPKQPSIKQRPAEKKPRGLVDMPEEILVEIVSLLDVWSIIALRAVSMFVWLADFVLYAGFRF